MITQGVDIAMYGCGPGYQYLSGVDNDWRFRADMVDPFEILVVPSEGSALLVSSANSSDLPEAVREIVGTTTRPRIAVKVLPAEPVA